MSKGQFVQDGGANPNMSKLKYRIIYCSGED